jgi:hypothetical protein
MEGVLGGLLEAGTLLAGASMDLLCLGVTGLRRCAVWLVRTGSIRLCNSVRDAEAEDGFHALSGLSLTTTAYRRKHPKIKCNVMYTNELRDR